MQHYLLRAGMCIGSSVKALGVWLFVAVVGLGAMHGIHAGPDAVMPVDPVAVFETMRSSISSLRTVILEGETKFVVGPDGQPDDARMQHASTIGYVGAGAKYVIDYVQTNEAGEVTWSERAAYNGMDTQNLRRHSGFLYIELGNIGAGPNCHSNVFFHPFTFLMGDRVEANDPILTMTDFHTPDRLRKFAASCKWLGVKTVREQECLVFEAPGGRTRYSRQPYNFRYRVYLSRTQGMYPIRWEQVTPTGQIPEALDVYKVDEIHGVRFPKVAVITRFQNGVLSGTIRREIQKIEINGEVNDREFTIDPSLAPNISDKGRWIKTQ